MKHILELKRALDSEQSIFEVFSSNRTLSDGSKMFYSSDGNSMPHWNSVYPNDIRITPSVAVLESARMAYEEMGKIGFLLSADSQYEKESIEDNEYFSIDDMPSKKLDTLESKFEISDQTDLSIFTDTLAQVFSFSVETKEYFNKKMLVLKVRPFSRFYVVTYQGEVCGTASVFRADSGSDFLFNVGVLPGFRGKNITSGMLWRVLMECNYPLYVYSPNPGMREKILPAAGFSSIGVIHTIPLDLFSKTHLLPKQVS